MLTSVGGFTGTIAAGQPLTFGHSSIAGLDFSDPSNDNLFDDSFNHFGIYAGSFTGVFADSIGVKPGAYLSSDTSYQGTTDRTPDTDYAGSNLGDFTATSPFSTNGLGSAVCFFPGSEISTPDGSRRVETLAIGDRVLTSDGRSVAVRWIGRQTLRKSIGVPRERLEAVRFSAGSLGNGLPVSDLMVTADHAMLLDGVLCHAAALVNGTTITRAWAAKGEATCVVYHIETENHEIILANGAPTETFIDNVSRRLFDNHAEFETLYGQVSEMEELPYPRAMSARQVPEAIRRKLNGVLAA